MKNNICNYCNKPFDIKKLYPVTYKDKVKYPRYCSHYCLARANKLRSLKGLNNLDKKYLNKVKN